MTTSIPLNTNWKIIREKLWLGVENHQFYIFEARTFPYIIAVVDNHLENFAKIVKKWLKNDNSNQSEICANIKVKIYENMNCKIQDLEQNIAINLSSSEFQSMCKILVEQKIRINFGDNSALYMDFLNICGSFDKSQYKIISKVLLQNGQSEEDSKLLSTLMLCMKAYNVR